MTDSRMRVLNRRFKGKDAPANILSFSHPKDFIIPAPPRKDKILGEIYLAPNYIKKHRENLDFMVIHGLLHLLGYDHAAKNDRMRMEKKEREIFAKI
jgi:probable rRNA maturation factor